jgi:hypothetical protein
LLLAFCDVLTQRTAKSLTAQIRALRASGIHEMALLNFAAAPRREFRFELNRHNSATDVALPAGGLNHQRSYPMKAEGITRQRALPKS